jgi:hypothetical protein
MTNDKSLLQPVIARFRSLPPTLQTFLAVDFTLLSFATTCEVICGYWLHLGHPYNSPLLWQYFPDIVNLRPRFEHFHTLRFFTDKVDLPYMYPAPVAVFYRLAYYFRPYDLGVFLAFTVLCAVVATVLYGRALITRGIEKQTVVGLLSYVFLTSYPLWYELKQANMEIIVWCIIASGVSLFLAGKSNLAAIFFGIAGAMKLFPFVYIGLFIARRQYRQIALLVAVSVLVTIPALWLIYPHIPESWRLTNAAVAQFGPLESLQIHDETGSDHSIFALIKYGVFLSMNPLTPRLLSGYLVTASVVGTALYFLVIRRLPVINQILCLCVASISFTPTSFDYTLMNLYIPWAVLVLYALRPENARRQVPGLSAAFVCLAILFVPETEIIFIAHTFGGQFKCLVLIALLLTALTHPFDTEVSMKEQLQDRADTLPEGIRST